MNKSFLLGIFLLIFIGTVFAVVSVDLIPRGTPIAASNIEVLVDGTPIDPDKGIYVLPETATEFSVIVKNLKTKAFSIGLKVDKTELVNKYYSASFPVPTGIPTDPADLIPFYGARVAKEKIDLLEKFTSPYDEECVENVGKNTFDCTLTFDKINGMPFETGKQVSLTLLIDEPPEDNIVQDAEIQELTVQFGPLAAVTCNSITDCMVEINKSFIGLFEQP
jgi:hypothetical protein